MADIDILQRMALLAQGGYLPSVGSWVELAPPITTVLNAFNTLGRQSMELFLLDREGASVGAIQRRTLETGKALRLDLVELCEPQHLPFEGCLWIWTKGDTAEGHLGLQAIDLDFIDRSRPDGHVRGTVHVIYDFLNTLKIPPYLDLVSPRVTVETTPDGAPRYGNFLGLAHVLVGRNLETPSLEISLINQAGEVLVASQRVELPLLGSRFVSLESLFPTLASFLQTPGEATGFGTVRVRELTPDTNVGLTAMLKVVDQLSGEISVDHLNDRAFARPPQKEA
jgi:hypothetical protein